MFNYSHVVIFGFKFVKGFYYSLQLQNSTSMFLNLICKERLIVMYIWNHEKQKHKGEDIIHEGKNKFEMNSPKSN